MPRMGFTYGIKTLSPASEVVKRGLYAATTLSAVDPDLAVGNIKKDVVLFGKTGTLEAGVDVSDADAAVGDVKTDKTFYSVAAPRKTGTLALVQDIVGSQITAHTCTTESGYRRSDSIAGNGELDIAAKTQNYAAGSLAVGVAAIHGSGSNIYLRCYMGGVQVAESAQMPTAQTYIAIGTRALVGSVECKAVAKNKVGSAQSLSRWSQMNGSKVPGGIGVGSIKT